MSSRYQHELSSGGPDVVRLQNNCVDVATVPQLGGKIPDLIDSGWSLKLEMDKIELEK